MRVDELWNNSRSLEDFLDQELPDEMAAWRPANVEARAAFMIVDRGAVERTLNGRAWREAVAAFMAASKRAAERKAVVQERLRELMITGKFTGYGFDPDAPAGRDPLPKATAIPYARWQKCALDSDLQSISWDEWQSDGFHGTTRHRRFQHVRIVPTKAPDGPKALPGGRKGFSQAAFEDWYRAYIKRHVTAGTIPGRDQDWEAAKQAFPGIPRDTVRDTRAQFAPENWQKPGRRGGD